MTERIRPDYVLAGDIGGTKTNLGIFKKGKKRPELKCFKTYSSADFPGLENIIEIFLKDHPFLIEIACFGVAGPVKNGICKTTNFPWEVHSNRIRKRFGLRNVTLLNDLTAMALSIPMLKKSELCTIGPSMVQKGQNIGLIAPGTGLGEAILLYHNKGYYPVASEGGHTNFPPANELEIDLWRYLSSMFGHVSRERILSGPGILNIYRFLLSTSSYREPSFLQKNLMSMDPARAITEAALNRGQRLCVKTLDIFTSILGAAAGDLALTGMTTGGVYLGGGIPPKILSGFREDIFMKAFTDKGRFSSLMKSIPVYVILKEDCALLGSAFAAFAGQDSIGIPA